MKLRMATLFLMALVAPGLPSVSRAQTSATGTRPAVTAPPVATTKPAAKPVAGRAAPADTGPTLVDINSADAKTLDALPGVGPVRAKAIVAGRPYTDKQDLLTRKILPANVFASVEGMIALVNVNTATAADMAKVLPNVGPVRADAVVKNRPYATAQEMVTKGALTQGVFDGVKSLVTVK